MANRVAEKGLLFVVSAAGLLSATCAKAPVVEPSGAETSPTAAPHAGPYCREAETPSSRVELDAGGARFVVSVLPGALSVTTEELARFLAASAEAVATLLGRFPASRVEVQIDPVGPGDEPVAFGLVRRERGPCVLLLVRENATLPALLADWTTVHELTHLVFPRLRDEDAWLSEGLATYYQEVLRARAALQSPADCWRRIERGFGLGRDDGTNRTLAEESRSMRRTFAFKRVYWSGAAFALELDVRLRSEHGRSLDQAIVAAEPAFRARAGRWSGRDLARALDAALDVATAEPLYDAYASRRDFPDNAPLLARLGLARSADGALELSDDAPLASTRRAITAPRP